MLKSMSLIGAFRYSNQSLKLSFDLSFIESHCPRCWKPKRETTHAFVSWVYAQHLRVRYLTGGSTVNGMGHRKAARAAL